MTISYDLGWDLSLVNCIHLLNTLVDKVEVNVTVVLVILFYFVKLMLTFATIFLILNIPLCAT